MQGQVEIPGDNGKNRPERVKHIPQRDSGIIRKEVSGKVQNLLSGKDQAVNWVTFFDDKLQQVQSNAGATSMKGISTQDLNEANKIADMYAEVSSDKDARSFLKEAAEFLDDTSAMAKLRDIWEGKGLSEENRHRIRFIKWLIINKPDYAIPDPLLTSLKLLYKCGFLSPYHDDPEMEKEYHQHLGNLDKKLLNWGTALAVILQPELIVVVPLLIPLNKIIAAKESTFTDIRNHLVTRRAQKSAKGKSAGTVAMQPPRSTGNAAEKPATKDISDFVTFN